MTRHKSKSKTGQEKGLFGGPPKRDPIFRGVVPFSFVSFFLFPISSFSKGRDPELTPVIRFPPLKERKIIIMKGEGDDDAIKDFFCWQQERGKREEKEEDRES